MRKPVYAVLVTGLLVSTLSIGAAPVGAARVGAASGTSCKSSTGSLSFSPTLPKLGSSAKVFAKLSMSGVISSCSGGGVSSGQLKFTSGTSKSGMNCATLAAYSSSPMSGTEAIAWDGGGTSTISLKLLDVKDSPTMERLQGTVTSGLFKGQKQSGLVQFSLPSNGCTKVGFSKASYRAINPLTIK
jgi:hypothetical protein